MAINRNTASRQGRPGTQIQFRMKEGGPKSIHKFDDSDISDTVSSSGNSSLPLQVHQDKPDCSVLPRSVPSHLLMISILEQLCLMYAKDSGKGRELFSIISEHLIRLKICSPLTLLDEMSSIRSQYRLFMHNVLKVAMLKLSKTTVQPLTAALDISIPREESHFPLASSEDMTQTSRYQTEFTEVQKIGTGGFGSVYKARHNLDGRLYAIKKIKFKHSRPELWMRVLREVKALANLQHANIVGYNAAWLENVPHNIADSPYSSKKATNDSIYKPPETSYTPEHQSTESDDGDIVFELPSDNHDNIVGAQDGGISKFADFNEGGKIKIKELRSGDSIDATSSAGICVACEESKEIDQPKIGFVKKHSCTRKYLQEEFVGKFIDTALLMNSKDMSLIVEQSSNANGTTWNEVQMNAFWNRRLVMKRSLSCDPAISGEKSVKHQALKQCASDPFDDSYSKIRVNLYIQMELCSLTLREWLQNRNQCCTCITEFRTYECDNMRIFKQILKGVDYIHSNGLIHRDLKPRNIFLHEPELHVKIGDFGLAKDDLGNNSRDDALLTPTPDAKEEINWDENSHHTSGVGTSTYAAPEQLKSTGYSNKCDIYSLGVILYEEYHMFKTEMEKFHCLDCLRRGEIDDTTVKYWPLQVRAIKKMTSIYPHERPSAKDLLQSELFLTKEQIILDLKEKVSDKDREIQQLKEMLKERDKVIYALKQDMESQIDGFK